MNLISVANGNTYLWNQSVPVRDGSNNTIVLPLLYSSKVFPNHFFI